MPGAAFANVVVVCPAPRAPVVALLDMATLGPSGTEIEGATEFDVWAVPIDIVTWEGYKFRIGDGLRKIVKDLGLRQRAQRRGKVRRVVIQLRAGASGAQKTSGNADQAANYTAPPPETGLHPTSPTFTIGLTAQPCIDQPSPPMRNGGKSNAFVKPSILTWHSEGSFYQSGPCAFDPASQKRCPTVPTQPKTLVIGGVCRCATAFIFRPAVRPRPATACSPWRAKASGWGCIRR